MKLKLFLLAVILILLALTNPTIEDFRDTAQEQVIKRTDQGSELEQALGNLFSGALSDLIVKSVRRDNYLLCSVYSIEYNKKTYRYIGLATRFIPLQKEQPFEPSSNEK